MSPLAKSMILALALPLLAACANTQEQEFKRNAAEANFKLGIGYMQSGHFEVATEKLLKALQYDDNYPEAHYAIAVLYEEMREYAPAETHFKKAIELQPDYTLAKLNMPGCCASIFPNGPPKAKANSRRSPSTRPMPVPAPRKLTPAWESVPASAAI